MTWNKPTLYQRFKSLDRDTRDELTDFLFARFVLIEYADGYVSTEPIRIVLKRAVQLFMNPEKMGMELTAECPACGKRFKMTPEDPIYLCPNCAHELDRCDWLVAIVFDYMKQEILDTLIEQEPAEADDLLKKAGNLPDQHFTRAVVANFRLSFLETLRNNGITISDDLFERNREIAVAQAWTSLFELFSNLTEEAFPSNANDHKEADHESGNQ